MALNMILVTARKSITADEIVLIPAAYYHLITNDPQLVREHPPLSKLLAGFLCFFIQPEETLPNQLEPSMTRPQREWAYSMRFWHDNRAQFEAISFWARVPMIALTLAFGLLTFIFARDLFGARAALFATALFALEPTLLAHGSRGANRRSRSLWVSADCLCLASLFAGTRLETGSRGRRRCRSGDAHQVFHDHHWSRRCYFVRSAALASTPSAAGDCATRHDRHFDPASSHQRRIFFQPPRAH